MPRDVARVLQAWICVAFRVMKPRSAGYAQLSELHRIISKCPRFITEYVAKRY